MATLSTDNRRLLERTIVDARGLAERAAKAALEALAVGRAKPDGHMSDDQKAVRNHLRARARQLGDKRAANDTHEITHLVRECAYEHWHRMLFARFLAENNLLIEPDAGVAISLDECKELAKDEKTDLWTLAGRYAQRMLPQIFRAGDPVLQVRLAREHELKLEGYVDGLPIDVFTATDSLGWCYQFWQTDEKKRVNESENKIGADELPAVTQLFTEDYMVDFLLDNTLGAWWAGKMLNRRDAENAESEEELRRKLALPGCPWKYLRFVRAELTAEAQRTQSSDIPAESPLRDLSASAVKPLWKPAAGTFDGWPKTAKELKCIDPCCGSGHFLVAMFERLVALRMAEERLNKRKAAEAVVRDNIFGLEIDPRCTQIAAFNLAMAAWKFAGYSQLPVLNLACSGLVPNAPKEEWLQLAEGNDRLQRGMERLYQLFQQAPILGSLIEPHTGEGDLLCAAAHDLHALLERALEAASCNAETHELGVAAQGIAKAAELLSGDFTFVATNVPFLARGKQSDVMMCYANDFFTESKWELATMFIDRCRRLVPGGSIGLVSPQNWLFSTRFMAFRRSVLAETRPDILARLDSGAFETISGEVVKVTLGCFSERSATELDEIALLDVSSRRGIEAKARGLRDDPLMHSSCRQQLTNPNHRILFSEESISTDMALEKYATCYQGLVTGDAERFVRRFWEVEFDGDCWECFLMAPFSDRHFESRYNVVRWQGGAGELAEYAAATREKLHDMHESGQKHWGKWGVAIGRVTRKVGLFAGEKFDNSVATVVPKKQEFLPALYAFMRSSAFGEALHLLDQKLSLTNRTILQVEFDSEHWQAAAQKSFPRGLPEPETDDPTQWTFDGRPTVSGHSLCIGVARLLGYSWPRQVSSAVPVCAKATANGLERYMDADGIVCIPSVRGEPGAADRLLALLTAAGVKPDCDLDDWLRNSFFDEHCKLFHDRPFVWHIWDGRKRDGFHALVNYHKFCGESFTAEAQRTQRREDQNSELRALRASAVQSHSGRRLLEKLTHAYLGDWITRQRAEVKDGKEGAEERLAAALALKERLEAIIAGEPPFDLFVRWKPLAKQAIGWEPDINDGVRMNIRPFMASDLPGGKKGAGVLRSAPKIKWTKDRGKEPHRAKNEYPWFWSWDEKTKDFMGGKAFDGNRWNDCHYSNDVKRKARG